MQGNAGILLPPRQGQPRSVGEEHGNTYAVDRKRFDAFMLDAAVQSGAVVLHNCATGIEINREDVMIYSEGENCKAAVVVGAFGLDDGTCRVFESSTPINNQIF